MGQKKKIRRGCGRAIKPNSDTPLVVSKPQFSLLSLLAAATWCGFAVWLVRNPSHPLAFFYLVAFAALVCGSLLYAERRA